MGGRAGSMAGARGRLLVPAAPWAVCAVRHVRVSTPPPPRVSETAQVAVKLLSLTPQSAVRYPPTVTPEAAVRYPPTAVGYPPTAVGYPPTAVRHRPTADGYPPNGRQLPCNRRLPSTGPAKRCASS